MLEWAEKSGQPELGVYMEAGRGHGHAGGGTGSTTGPHVHADNRQYGTRMSAWYTSKGTTCGTNASCGDVIGAPTL